MVYVNLKAKESKIKTCFDKLSNFLFGQFFFSIENRKKKRISADLK